MAVSDLTKVTETATLFNWPKQLGSPAVDLFPVQSSSEGLSG